jgi:peroxiredoxin
MAPDFSVPDRKGRPVRLSQFLGKKVLLVTWASW